MASDDGGERTEDPTPKRLADARKKGQIPRSKDLGTAAVLMGSAVALLAVGKPIAGALTDIMKASFSLNREQVFDPNLMLHIWEQILVELAAPMAWVFLIVFAAAFIGNILLGGMNISTEAMMPKFNKLSPLKGAKRMFGVQALVELLKSIAKVSVVGGVMWWLLSWQFGNILTLSTGTLPGSAFDALYLVAWIFLTLCCSLLIIAAIDVPYQIWNHKKQLKMTKQEVKDEFKNTEGKPEVKGRIRRMQMEMSNRRMMADVPEADVVVTNPTHYSVALKYSSDGPGAPVVVAQGVDEVALKIREIAREYEIPVMQSPALARAIFHSTEVGETIPEGLYVAVAQILAYIFQLNQFRKGKGQRPKALPKDFDIPEELRKDE